MLSCQIHGAVLFRSSTFLLTSVLSSTIHLSRNSVLTRISSLGSIVAVYFNLNLHLQHLESSIGDWI
jgi:hypothetical protein